MPAPVPAPVPAPAPDLALRAERSREARANVYARVVAIAIGLLKMLLELQQTRKTGALDVAGPGARVRLFVEDGQVVFADEGTVGGALGLMLEHEHATEAQVQQKLMRALAWSSATFRFIESRGPLDVPNRLVTTIEPLVIAALRLADRERLEELILQARPRYAALRGDSVPGGGSAKLVTIARVNAFRLSASEDAFARTLDGSRTVADLLADEGADEVDRCVILAGLLLTDVLDLHRGPIAVRPMGVPRPVSRAPAKVDADVAPEARQASGSPAPSVMGATAEVNAEADANANANANAEADADANAEADAEADADAEAEAEAGAEARVEVSARARSASAGWLIGMIVVAAVAGGVLLMRARVGEGVAEVDASAVISATGAPASTGTSAKATADGAEAAEPAASASAAMIASPERAKAAPSPSGAPGDASYVRTSDALPTADATKGVISLPSAADGHRVYVDGRLAGVPPPAIVVACGHHVVKIGSQGREQQVLVPCGGALSIPYP